MSDIGTVFDDDDDDETDSDVDDEYQYDDSKNDIANYTASRKSDDINDEDTCGSKLDDDNDYVVVDMILLPASSSNWSGIRGSITDKGTHVACEGSVLSLQHEFDCIFTMQESDYKCDYELLDARKYTSDNEETWRRHDNTVRPTINPINSVTIDHDNYVLISMNRICRHCTFINHDTDVVCQICDMALVANPNVTVDALLAHQLQHNEEHNEEASLFKEFQRLDDDKDSYYDDDDGGGATSGTADNKDMSISTCIDTDVLYSLKIAGSVCISPHDEKRTLDAASGYNDSSLHTDQFVVHAPAGKLGLVVDIIDNGAPVVYSIKNNSVLIGQVNVGDRLIGVDKVDVRTLPALEVSKIIARRSSNPIRKLTFVRGKQE